MKVLVVGSGGREHALVWKISQSPRVKAIYCTPGNAGIARLARCVDAARKGVEAIRDFAEAEGIDLTVIGSETFLASGIVNEFQKRGLPIFGPTREAAQIEVSKLFAKNIMNKYSIPTAEHRVFSESKDAIKYIQTKYGQMRAGRLPVPIVVKADGAALGKGVVLTDDLGQAIAAVRAMMENKIYGEAGATVLIEEFLTGEEATILAFSDGKSVVPMVPSQDHKRAFDGDKGPNTGGMGAYAPAPVVDHKVAGKVVDKILIPMVKGMAREGFPFVGVLYAGLMIDNGAVKVVEFNARFGDPEAQAVLPLLASDLVDIMEACITGRLDSIHVRWHDMSAACVVLASGGYPDHYETGKEILGLEDAELISGVTVFHAGTKLANGKILTNGGRVLGVTGIGSGIRDAIDTAYRGVDKISYDGMHYRRDIAYRAFSRD